MSPMSMNVPRRHHRAGARRVGGTAALMALLLAGSGCASVEPWVQPYERERLAAPIMAFELDPLQAKHREHVYVVREAARGATGVQGGGCGCN